MDKQIKKQGAEMKDLELFLENNSDHLETIKMSKTGALIFALSPGLRRKYAAYKDAASVEEKVWLCGDVLDAYEESPLWRARIRLAITKRDGKIRAQQKGSESISIDNTPKDAKDYYSVAVIIKNEARHMREFILFYQATGADRIYVYDNDSTDNIREVLDPFISSGFVIYNTIHGRNVQDYVYRDAVKRSRKRTKWLAIIDADEYLFSPKSDMPEMLKEYEQYPGIGANWVMYGPSGHAKRPDGLTMDNYTETYADRNSMANRHIKSIVRPDKVFTVLHTHYPIYKGKEYAVDECGNKIGNRCAYVRSAGRAFTETHEGEVFRINHYFTRSLEDLREKCDRGYADGAGNRVFEDALDMFDAPMTEDYSIKPYADIVRTLI